MRARWESLLPRPWCRLRGAANAWLLTSAAHWGGGRKEALRLDWQSRAYAQATTPQRKEVTTAVWASRGKAAPYDILWQCAGFTAVCSARKRASRGTLAPQMRFCELLHFFSWNAFHLVALLHAPGPSQGGGHAEEERPCTAEPALMSCINCFPAPAWHCRSPPWAMAGKVKAKKHSPGKGLREALAGTTARAQPRTEPSSPSAQASPCTCSSGTAATRERAAVPASQNQNADGCRKNKIKRQ